MQSIFVERGPYLKWKSNMKSSRGPPEKREIYLSVHSSGCDFSAFLRMRAWPLCLACVEKKRPSSSPQPYLWAKSDNIVPCFSTWAQQQPAAPYVMCGATSKPQNSSTMKCITLKESMKKPILSSMAAERQKWLWDQKGQYRWGVGD